MTWKSIRLPDCLVDHEVGRANQINTSDIQPVGRFPVVDQGQTYIAGYTDDAERVIRDGLPYVIFGDHTRCFKYVDFPFVLGADGTKVLKPNPELFVARFFYYATLALEIPSRGYNRHFTLLKEKLIPRPELDEQRRIAVVLSAVRRAIERQGRLAALTAELKKSLMQRLFTEGARGESLKQTEIGPVPQSWRVVSIRQECIDCAFGPRFSSKEYVPDGGITTLRTTDMDDDGHIDYTHAPRANLDPTRFAPHLLQVGDIVVSRSGTCGIASVFESYERPVLPGAFLIRLRMRDAVYPYYLRDYLNSAQGRARTALIAEGAIQKNISGTRLQDFLIPLPLHGEQVAIVGAIDNVARVGAVNQQRKGALERLFRTLLHELMNGRVRVDSLDLSAVEEAKKELVGAV